MRISVIIPTLDEAEHIAGVIRVARLGRDVHEVIVVDDCSVDDTAAIARRAGARVISSDLLGKGASMEDGLRASSGDLVVYLDGDLDHLAPDLIDRLTAPLRAGRADFVKARFSRAAGRVTLLTAKPLVATFFPELAHFEQPLGGLIAGRRSLFEKLDFENDYGVDLALLLDAWAAGARLEEVDIGHLEHDSQNLDALGRMAKQVVRVLLHRAHRYGRLHQRYVHDAEEADRHAGAGAAALFGGLRRPPAKVALLDMDGTLVRERTILKLAERAGRLTGIARWLDRPTPEEARRNRRIAACLAGLSREAFVHTARHLTLTEGARDLVRGLRRAGWCVGIVSDSYRIVTEIVRRRVFADFSVGHLLRFRDGQATGELTPSPLFQHDAGCRQHALCKSNVLAHIEERLGVPRQRVLAAGDGANDACLVQKAGVGIAFEPKSDTLARVARIHCAGDLRQLLAAAG